MLNHIANINLEPYITSKRKMACMFNTYDAHLFAKIKSTEHDDIIYTEEVLQQSRCDVAEINKTIVNIALKCLAALALLAISATALRFFDCRATSFNVCENVHVNLAVLCVSVFVVIYKFARKYKDELTKGNYILVKMEKLKALQNIRQDLLHQYKQHIYEHIKGKDVFGACNFHEYFIGDLNIKHYSIRHSNKQWAIEKKTYREQITSLISANRFDRNSLPAMLPKEVISIITKIMVERRARFFKNLPSIHTQW